MAKPPLKWWHNGHMPNKLSIQAGVVVLRQAHTRLVDRSRETGRNIYFSYKKLYEWIF